jgi:hypothetical protein
MPLISFLTKHNHKYNYFLYPKSSYRFYNKEQIVYNKKELELKIIFPHHKPYTFVIKSKNSDGLSKHKITKMLHHILYNEIKCDKKLIIYGLTNNNKSKYWHLIYKEL